MEYLLIFLAKIIEVSLTTVRTVFITKGQKLYSSIIGFIEVSIWLLVASVVLVGINENPAKMFVYALGFTFGNYIGSIIEEKIGLGHVSIQIITNCTDGTMLSDSLRKAGKAVTVLKGEGKDSEKCILLIYAKRKQKDCIMREVKKLDIQAVITISEAQKIYGGYGVGK